jgi:hypothetical protein
VKPFGHSHWMVPSTSEQVPPLRQGASSQLPSREPAMEQVGPEKPGGQLQTKPLASSLQLAPFSHGRSAQLAAAPPPEELDWQAMKLSARASKTRAGRARRSVDQVVASC